MSSVTSTLSCTEPERELTSAMPPSPRLRARASSGWINSVQRSGPFTSRALLCSQLLLERTCRRPMSRRRVSATWSSSAAKRVRSPTNSSGAMSMVLSGVFNRSGNLPAVSGPKSMPLGCASTSSSETPKGPARIIWSSISRGVWPSTGRPVMAPASPRRISQSASVSSSFSNKGGEYLAKLRIAMGRRNSP